MRVCSFLHMTQAQTDTCKSIYTRYSMLCSTQCYALLNAIIMLYSKGGFELTNELRNEYAKNMQLTKTENEQIHRV